MEILGDIKMTVTLQTKASRRIGKKAYLKSLVTIPRNLVNDLGWSDNQELDLRQVSENKLMLRPAQPRLKINNSTFESFARAIVKVLVDSPEGLTWSQIREVSNLPNKRPCPLWVHRMENERGLLRFRDNKSSQIIWKMK